MLKKMLSVLLLTAMLLQLVPIIAPKAEATTYTSTDWSALIANYKRDLCGDSSVNWTDEDVQVIVNRKNASGVTTSGIGYKGWNNWQDLESNRSNAKRIFGTTNIVPGSTHTSTMVSQFDKLLTLAQAYGTNTAACSYLDSNGTLVTKTLYQNQELRDAIFYGLDKGCDAFYNKTAFSTWRNGANVSTTHNWHDWASQIPDSVMQTLLIMYPYKTSTEKTIANTAISACEYFLTYYVDNTVTEDGGSGHECLNIYAMLSAIK